MRSPALSIGFLQHQLLHMLGMFPLATSRRLVKDPMDKLESRERPRIPRNALHDDAICCVDAIELLLICHTPENRPQSCT